MSGYYVGTFWEDSNYNGSSIDLYGFLNNVVNIDLSTYFSGTFNNKISSFTLSNNPNFMVVLRKDYNGSEQYTFRGPVEVPSTGSFGLNDNISQIVIINILDPNNKQGQGQAIVYKNLIGQSGLSAWVPGPTQIPNISTPGSLPNGSFPNDSITSVRLFPNTRLTLFKDANYGGDSRVYTNDSTNPTVFVDTVVDQNDTCTSLKLEYFY